MAISCSGWVYACIYSPMCYLSHINAILLRRTKLSPILPHISRHFPLAIPVEPLFCGFSIGMADLRRKKIHCSHHRVHEAATGMCSMSVALPLWHADFGGMPQIKNGSEWRRHTSSFGSSLAFLPAPKRSVNDHQRLLARFMPDKCDIRQT